MTKGPHPNILFLLVDGLRADYFHGENKIAETPAIDSLIDSGVYFENAISCSDITAYSLKSIFSGCFPIGCGIIKERFERTHSEKTSFLSILKNSGYHLYAHMGKAIFNQGFQKVFENEDVTLSDSVYGGLTKKIIEKITSNSLKEPWFFYIHPMDVHVPCEVPDEFKKLSLKERYNLNISSIDSLIGQIIEQIDLSNTIVILTSDHGEYIDPFDTYKGIQDNSNTLVKSIKKSIKKIIPETFHSSIHVKKKNIQNQIRSTNFNSSHEKRNLEARPGKNRMLFDDIVHVPLLISGFGIKHLKPISMQVGTIDIFPTLLKIIEIEYENKIHGRNLLSLINEEKIDPRPIYMENALMKTIIKNSTSCIGIRTDKFKYFRDSQDSKKNVNLYDLTKDHFEDHNIAKNNLEEIKQFERIILEIKNNAISDKKLEEFSLSESEEIERELKKLGYI